MIEDNHSFPTYEETRKLLLQKDIRSVVAYRKFYYTSPIKVPYHPNRVYIKPWVNWYVFLNNHDKIMVPYDVAKKIVKKAGIQTFCEYEQWYKTLDHRLPAIPPRIYKNDWKSWDEFFSRKPKFATFEEAKQIVYDERIRSCTEYKLWYRESPRRLPSTPQLYYPEWVNWYHFLGK